MAQNRFQFKNQEVCFQTQRKIFFVPRAIKGLIIFSSLFVCIVFLTLKVSGYLKPYKKSLTFNKTLLPQEKTPIQKSYSLPLFVSLKGEKGPQLMRVYVSLNVAESSKKELMSKESQLEKRILFLLSGQPAKALSSKKSHFEKQIHFHLNAFLSKKIVNSVHIQTQSLN